jgi:polar amino acid transport system substrate-binding protein
MIKRIVSIAVAIGVIGIAATTASAQSTVEAIKKRGELIVGVRYDMPPFGYIADGGSIQGVDITISNEIARRLGVKLKTVQVTAQTRIPMIQSGNIDLLAAGLANTKEREKVIDFSETYFDSGSLFLVRSDSKATSYRDFAGRTIATVQGTPYLPLLVDTGLKFDTVTFQEYPQAMLAVANGKADALMADDATLATIVGKARDLKIIGNLTDFPRWHIAIGVQKGNKELLGVVNATLAEMWKKGELQEAVRKQNLKYDPSFEIRP